MSYGTCPQCGAEGICRERRPNGNDKCANGHVYPSRDSLPPTPEAFIFTEKLAESITQLAEMGRLLAASPLKQDTIILLLHHATKVGKKDIAYILNALPELERTYLKPKKK